MKPPVIAGISCACDHLRQISESTNRFAVLSALRLIRWSLQVEMDVLSGSVSKSSKGPSVNTVAGADNERRFWWWSWRVSNRDQREA